MITKTITLADTNRKHISFNETQSENGFVFWADSNISFSTISNPTTEQEIPLVADAIFGFEKATDFYIKGTIGAKIFLAPFDGVAGGSGGSTGSGNDLGYFPTVAELQAAYPTGTNGQYSLIGETDTFWVWDGDTSAWKDSGVSASPNYTGLSPATNTVGGVTPGYVLTGKSISQIIQDMCVSYQNPTFSSFSFPQSTPIEVGTIISGNKTFTWATTNTGNVSANSISILDITGSSTLASGLANDGSEILNIGSVSKVTATSHTWRITGVNTNAITFQRDFSIAWQWRRFYGESLTTPLDEAGIEALRVSGLATTFAGAYSFAAGGYKYISYPTTFGTATTFKDASTNLDIPMEAPYNVNITNTNGVSQDYRVHRTTNIMGGAFTMNVS